VNFGVAGLVNIATSGAICIANAIGVQPNGIVV
jgi:uncharacterized circularly permuted ATP-grasp superfamily protein